jgi:hypothetical protein
MDVVMAVLQLGALGAASWAVLASARSHRESIELLTFTQWTERFARVEREVRAHPAKEDDDNVVSAYSPLFDLWAEEAFLWRRRQIPSEVWDLWRAGMVRVLTSPEARRAWALGWERYSADIPFTGLVGELISEAEGMARGRPGPPPPP